ncbi:MAG: DUF4439 domain-containing protein, partial [Actinomycetes bacterium]
PTPSACPSPASTAAPSATATSAPATSAPAPEETTAGGIPAGRRQALSAALAVEQQAVYGYQAALPRLAPAEAGPASEFLARHRDLAADAEERLRFACGTAAPQQPGYVLDPAFLAAPVAALGKLEAATLAAYGDMVAVSAGGDRKWALAALQSAANRAQQWGADPGPLPGLTLAADQLPALPAATSMLPDTDRPADTGTPAGTSASPAS